MAEKPFAIKADHLHKSFKLPHERAGSVKSALVNFYSRKKGYEKQHVLKDISFEIKKGEFFGIVGRNGSGKSTLLKLIAGIYTPDEGDLKVVGNLTPFIELGVGFNPELTGRENVFLNGALLGFNRKEMALMYDDIVKFAELEPFMDQKLKNYSSGMHVRLAFAIAIRARSDILLIDEVLAVGDAVFQKKCYNYFRELKKQKKTVVFISHDANVLQEYCNRGILIDNGKIVSRGKISRVVNDYIDLLNDVEETDAKTENEEQRDRWGNGAVTIEKARLFRDDGKTHSVFTEKDKFINVEVTYKAKEVIKKPIYGITITDTAGQRMFTSNTMWSEVKTGTLKSGQKTVVKWRVPNIFATGDFSLSPAVAGDEGAVMYDWIEGSVFFKIRKKLRSTAYTNVLHDITVE